MFKWFYILLAGILVSMFFFPFEFFFLPGVNTKMMEAALGLFFCLIVLVKQRKFDVPKQLLILIILAGVVSLVGFFSITYNQTEDTAYATFITSVAVWLSAAFTVCFVIRLVHGELTIPLIVNYLISVCLFQCIIALLIYYVPSVRMVVDTYVNQGQALLTEMDRLYGIGASLDVAGSRFAVILVCIAFLAYKRREISSRAEIVWYIISFLVITVIGNMMARTTLIGTAISVVFLVIMMIIPVRERAIGMSRVVWSFLLVLVAVVPIITTLYRSNDEFYNLMRFGFEGFFSLAERGEWDVSSTNTLKTMIVFPDNMKTWIIGDGYFANSRNDVNYLGDSTDQGFYMGTDIGYLRFIFYFGLIGLFMMVLFMSYAAYACSELNQGYKWMFVLTLMVGLIVWLKVSTDVFPALALFFCVGLMQDEDVENLDEQEGQLPETQ